METTPIIRYRDKQILSDEFVINEHGLHDGNNEPIRGADQFYPKRTTTDETQQFVQGALHYYTRKNIDPTDKVTNATRRLKEILRQRNNYINALEQHLKELEEITQHSFDLAKIEMQRISMGSIKQLPLSLPAFTPNKNKETSEEKFNRLLDSWKKESNAASLMIQKIMLPSYQSIIGMGKDAIRFLLEELQREPDDWFWALECITGEHPIKKEDEGRFDKLTESWLQWGKMNGYIS